MKPAPPFAELPLRASSEPPAPTALQRHKIRVVPPSTSVIAFNHLPASIHSVPCEMLAHILWFVFDHENVWQTGLLWVESVSHVCRKWRRVALATPRIWSCIRFNLGPRWTSEMLQRAQAAPIHIYRYCRSDRDHLRKEEIKFIPEHMSHIQTLVLSSKAEELDAIVNQLTQPAPILHHLRLDNHSGTSLTVPLTLFAGDVPQLRGLGLHTCRVSWASPLFSNSLVSLVLDDIHECPSLERLLDILQNSPKLHTLHLVNALPLVSAVPPPSRVISLPALSTLELTGRDVDCAALIQSLSYPPSTSLQLSCTARSGQTKGTEIALLLPWITAKLAGATTVDLWKLEIVAVAENLFFMLEGTVDGTNCRLEFHSMRFSGSRIRHMPAMIEALCRALPTDNVLDLTVDHCALSAADWTDILGPMQRVRILRAHGLSLYNFPAALLMHVAPHGDPKGFPVPIFPCLASLSVGSCSLDVVPENDGDVAEGDRPPTPAPATLLSRLQYALINRTVIGRPVGHLRVLYANVSRISIGLLQAVVRHVEWDQEERGHKGL